MRYAAVTETGSGGPAVATPPPTREVTLSGSDGGYGFEAPDDALGARVLPVSLLSSPAATVREENGHLERLSHEADSTADRSTEDATPSTDTAEPEEHGGEDGDEEASAPDDDSRGVLDTLIGSVVVRPVVRFLYAVGYVEVTAVRAVLRGLGLRSPDDGGES